MLVLSSAQTAQWRWNRNQDPGDAKIADAVRLLVCSSWLVRPQPAPRRADLLCHTRGLSPAAIYMIGFCHEVDGVSVHVAQPQAKLWLRMVDDWMACAPHHC